MNTLIKLIIEVTNWEVVSKRRAMLPASILTLTQLHQEARNAQDGECVQLRCNVWICETMTARTTACWLYTASITPRYRHRIIAERVRPTSNTHSN